MPSFNAVMLMGNITRDPEIRYTEKGDAVCNLNMAVNRKYKVKEEMREEVCFVTVVTWRKQAEACGGFLKKGDPVFVYGRLQSRKWETESKEKRTQLEVVAEKVEFLMRGEKKTVVEDAGTPAPETQASEEDIPF